MFSSTLEDACYQEDIFKRVLSEEIAFLQPPEDALECLVGTSEGEALGYLNDERAFMLSS